MTDESIGGMLRIALILTVIMLLSAIALAVTHIYTKPFIDQTKEQKLKEGLSMVVTQADDFKDLGGGYYEALLDGKVIGKISTVYADGYNDKIKMLIGISDGKILGVHILEHLETPGLGARSTEVRPDEDEPWFLRQFKGLDSVALKKDGGNIDAITAATITSRAITDAVAEELRK